MASAITPIICISPIRRAFESARIEKVAYQHTGRIAPLLIGGLAPATQGRDIDNIVVKQSGGVNKFNNRSHLQMLLALIAIGQALNNTTTGRKRLPPESDNIVANILH